MPNISIKHAKLHELPRVKYVTKLAYKIPYKKNSLITLSHEPKNILDSFAKKEFFVLAAYCNKKIVGAVRYKFQNNNQLYIFKLAVLKTYRNQSIGSALIKKVEKIAAKKSCNKILLDCAQEKKLPDYYKKLGYKTDLVKKHEDHHDVYMSKCIK